jgi:hypothetical protein
VHAHHRRLDRLEVFERPEDGREPAAIEEDGYYVAGTTGDPAAWARAGATIRDAGGPLDGAESALTFARMLVSLRKLVAVAVALVVTAFTIGRLKVNWTGRSLAGGGAEDPGRAAVTSPKPRCITR